MSSWSSAAIGRGPIGYGGGDDQPKPGIDATTTSWPASASGRTTCAWSSTVLGQPGTSSTGSASPGPVTRRRWIRWPPTSAVCEPRPFISSCAARQSYPPVQRAQTRRRNAGSMPPCHDPPGGASSHG
jgi:hypothetical protein